MPYKNKEDHAKAQLRYRTKILAVIAEARSHGCLDCPEIDPIVMEFHHRNPQEKKFTIGGAPGTMAIPRLLEEIAKCDVICANCHKRRHHKITLDVV